MVYCLGRLLPLDKLVTGGLKDTLGSCSMTKAPRFSLQEISSDRWSDATDFNPRVQSTGARDFEERASGGIARCGGESE